MRRRESALSYIFEEDTDQILSDENIPWAFMRGNTVLVTGATGLIGSALVKALSAANTRYRLGIRIYAAGRDREKGARLLKTCGAQFLEHDVRKPFFIFDQIDYIFHCAAVTRSSEMAAHPVDVTDTMLNGTMNVLELAREKKVRSMVYLSSMEVYGVTDPAKAYIREKDLGYIDLNNPRNCYPESKRLCENLCCNYLAQYHVPVKIARLAQTFGAGISKDDPRVFAQFARNALAGEDIVLHTEGKSRGNYCYLSDAVRALLLLLLKGENGEAYNVSNPEASATIREMAEIVAGKVFGGRVSVAVRIPADISKRGYAPDTAMRLDIEKIMRLGWSPCYDLADMYTRMIEDWNAPTYQESWV
jgi:UDP-glucuronate decarboxylase